MADNELFRLLSTDTAENQWRLQEWLRKTPPNAAADQLARIIHKHRPAPASTTRTVQAIFIFAASFGLILLILKLAFDVKLSGFPFMFWYIPFIIIISQNSQIGRKASLLLAELNDQRAIAGLAASWSPSVRRASDSGENERIEAEITRLTTLYTSGHTGPYMTTSAALRKMLQRAVQTWRRDIRRGIRLDFSDSRADMLLSAVRFIGHNGTLEDRVVLKQIASLPLPNDTSANRGAVREAATYFVEGQTMGETVLPTAATPVSALSQQTVGRRP
jgi:hypothetical protein